VQRDSSGDSVKTHRQASEVSRESYVTRPNHDVSTNVSKQRSDYAEDIRTPSQPPPPRLRASDLRQRNNEFDGWLSESSSLYCDQQSSNHIRAEEFLRKPLSHSAVDVLALIFSSHSVMMKVLSSRNNSLQVVKAMWSAGKIKTATESALHMRDQAVLLDVINLMLNKTFIVHCTELQRHVSLNSTCYNSLVAVAGHHEHDIATLFVTHGRTTH